MSVEQVPQFEGDRAGLSPADDAAGSSDLTRNPDGDPRLDPDAWFEAEEFEPEPFEPPPVEPAFDNTGLGVFGQRGTTRLAVWVGRNIQMQYLPTAITSTGAAACAMLDKPVGALILLGGTGALIAIHGWAKGHQIRLARKVAEAAKTCVNCSGRRPQRGPSRKETTRKTDVPQNRRGGRGRRRR